MPLVCWLYHSLGVGMGDRMSGHVFAKNPWLVSEEVAFCSAGVASSEAGKK